MFVRLVYTDQFYTGSASLADFDGDGLTNAQEVTAGWGTDPFVADTDADGWGDKQENLAGSSGTDSLVSPPRLSGSYLAMNRTVDVQYLHSSESYGFSRSKNSQGEWGDYGWSQNWTIPGSEPPFSQGGFTSSTPQINFHDTPTGLLESTSYWQASNMVYQPYAPALYVTYQPSGYPYAKHNVDVFNTNSYASETGGWGAGWYRYRLHLTQPVNFEDSLAYLVLRHDYERNTNPEIEANWKHVDGPVSAAAGMTLTTPAGATTGSWHFQAHEPGGPNTLHAYQVIPVPFTLRASPGMRFNPQSENGAYNAIVESLGNEIDQLGALQMGYGRASLPGGAYVAPVEVYATVPTVPGISWEWKRHVKAASWRLRFERSDGVNGPLSGPHVWKVVLAFPRDQNDDPQTNHQDVTPSAAGRIYTGDASGVDLPLEANPLNVGDFLYYEKLFTYKLKCTAPNGSFEIGSFKVAQIIGLKRTGQNGNASDYQPIMNTNFQGGVDVSISQQEVWSLTGNRAPVQLP
jgi:hypothetical protein